MNGKYFSSYDEPQVICIYLQYAMSSSQRLKMDLVYACICSKPRRRSASCLKRQLNLVNHQ